jgi:hypothetical protein
MSEHRSWTADRKARLTDRRSQGGPRKHGLNSITGNTSTGGHLPR